MRCLVFSRRLAIKIQFDWHEESVWFGTRKSFGYRERNRDPGRCPAFRHPEGPDPEPVHSAFQHILNVIEVLPQKCLLRLDTCIHNAYPRLKCSFLPKEMSGRSLTTSPGCKVRSFWSSSTSMTPCDTSQLPSAAISSVEIASCGHGYV